MEKYEIEKHNDSADAAVPQIRTEGAGCRCTTVKVLDAATMQCWCRIVCTGQGTC